MLVDFQEEEFRLYWDEPDEVQVVRFDSKFGLDIARAIAGSIDDAWYRKERQRWGHLLPSNRGVIGADAAHFVIGRLRSRNPHGLLPSLRSASSLALTRKPYRKTSRGFPNPSPYAISFRDETGRKDVRDMVNDRNKDSGSQCGSHSFMASGLDRRRFVSGHRHSVVRCGERKRAMPFFPRFSANRSGPASIALCAGKPSPRPLTAFYFVSVTQCNWQRLNEG